MSSKPVVYVARQKEYDAAQIQRWCESVLDRDGLSVKGKSVFVKPSFVYPARPPKNIGINTQPAVVGGVVRALKERGAAQIWVGEDCLVGPSQCGFFAMGVHPFIRGAAQPLYLQREPRVEVQIDNPLVEDRFRLPKKFMEADLFVSLPKLKVNMYATITLSVKNHIGLLLQADRLTNHHYNIHKKIADLYRSRVPDFIITDAICAGQGQGPMHAEALPTGLLIGGRNGLAVDATCCHAMGYRPEEVEHLVHLHDLGLGSLNLDDIEVEGRELLEQQSRPAERPRWDFSDYHPSDWQFCLGEELACPEGCVGMIRGTLDSWARAGKWSSMKGFTFIAGKPISKIPSDLNPRKTIVVGDCAAEHAGLGTFLPGCPVSPMDLTYALLKKGRIAPMDTRLLDLFKGFAANAFSRHRG